MRPVPRLIDRPSRSGEVIVVFMAPLFLLRTIDPLFALLVAIACALVFLRVAVGRPEGYLLHSLYRMGLQPRGLLNLRIRRLVP